MKAGGDAPAHERVRQRIVEWVEQHGQGAQRKLAKAVPAPEKGDRAHRSDQWISDIVNRRSDITIQDLDAVADHMGVPPGELVRKPDRNYLELTMTETKVLQFFRELPGDAQRHWLGWLEYVFRKPTLSTVGKIGKRKNVLESSASSRVIVEHAHGDSGSAKTGVVSREALIAEREELQQQSGVLLIAINDLTARIDALAPPVVDRLGSGSPRFAAGDHVRARTLARNRTRKK